MTCTAIIRKCTAKVEKYTSIMQVAKTNFNSIHQYVSKALVDSKISEKEFVLVIDKTERYQAMKPEVNSSDLRITLWMARQNNLERGRRSVPKSPNISPLSVLAELRM